jgi:anti-sigma regulatory factor (Ser/Thr protein kinase)
LVRDALTAWGIGQLGADAALVASELAGNAIQHAGCQSFRLSIALLAQRRIRISVSDQGGALPEMLRAPDEESERGRGLLIVAAIADRWGTEVVGPDKTVWTELSTERP